MKKIFVSYSHTDEKYKDQLLKHLAPLKHQLGFDIWDDGKLIPGQSWNTEIKSKLNNADIILLLVSSDAIASDYITNHEISIALERHDRCETIVIPVILRPCNWQILKIAENQALPKNAKPISKWSNRDDAYLNIVTGISNVISIKHEIKPHATPTHKITLITGLTCSGKDTLLIYIYDELYKTGDQFHFMNKVITRSPRAEETLYEGPLTERSTAPYYVIKVDSDALEFNANNKYFNTFYKYGNYTGFDRTELIEMLKDKRERHIVYINSDITNIERHKSELSIICDQVKAVVPYKINIQTVLLDCDPATCRKRLKARGLDEKARKRKYAEIDADYLRLNELKQNNFFKHVVNNSNNDAINSSLPEFIGILS